MTSTFKIDLKRIQLPCSIVAVVMVVAVVVVFRFWQYLQFMRSTAITIGIGRQIGDVD